MGPRYVRCLIPAGSFAVEILALGDCMAGVLWDQGINFVELSVFFLACYLHKVNAKPTKSQAFLWQFSPS